MAVQYATRADLESSALPAAAISGMSDATVNACLLRASAKADSMMRGRGTVPLTPPYDPALVQAVCEIAALYIMKDRGFNPENGPDQLILKAHDVAIAWLRDVSAGRATISNFETVAADIGAPAASSLPLREY